MEQPILLWFKNDLRLHDNETLIKAIESQKPIIPIFIFDTGLFKTLELGFHKTDQVRLDFLIQSVNNLKLNLERIGGKFMIRTGNPSDIIVELIKTYQCSALYLEKEFATEELNTIQSIKDELPSGVDIHEIWGRTLHHLEDIPYTIEKIPLTSKAFRINTTKSTEPRKTMAAPKKIFCAPLSKKECGDVPSLESLGFTSKNYALTYLPGGEDEALKRLDYYLFKTQNLTSYRWSRNRSLGLEYSSKFSPYMALGCLSPRTIYEAVKRYEQDIKRNQSTWWLIFEIVWRDYFTFKLMRFQNAVYHTEGFTKKTMEFTNNEDLFKRWCSGMTGIPFVDAHMRQLNATGFMSNRGRVNCSSFMVHDYQIDWTWGAAYFESKLIDYDVASNWMNWHAQTYQTWYTNPVNQSNKYKAQDFIRKWIPELAHLDDREILIPWEIDDLDYPKPNDLHSKWNRSINKIKKD